ncbi:MAG: hypothetical protein J0L86_15055 [Flavobacteriales bacterium]|nr:hypothetical protein [Flavobacteriales bacterium]
MKFEKTFQQFEEYTQSLSLREDPENGSYEHLFEIEQFQNSEYNKLNNIFKEEYQDYINQGIYFYGCPFEVYSKSYQNRLKEFIENHKSEYKFNDDKTSEILFIENELKEKFEHNPYLFIDEDLKAIIKKSISDRDKFLNQKLESLDNENTIENEMKFPDYCFIGSLFAQGFIKKEKDKYYFKTLIFDTANEISEYIKNNVLEKPINSVSQYIRDTTNHSQRPRGGNDFYQSKGMMKKIIQFCNYHNIEISDDFQAKYNILNN